MGFPKRPLLRAAALCAAVILSSAAFAADPARNLAVSKTADSAQVKEQRVALVIGNSSYKSAPLKNPVNDAEDIAKALQGLGFQVTLKQNQSREGMAQAIREFGNKLKRGGTGLFYYAGHGMQVKGKNFLIPVDADIQTEDEVPYRGIDANELLAKMESARNRVNLVILDACRNNPFARSFRSSAQGLAQMDAPVGTLVAFATSPGSVAADGHGRNGLYTQHLLASMNQPGLKIEDVFKRVRQGARKGSANRQVPWENTSLEGDFYFLQPGQAAPAGPPTAVASLAPTLAPDPVRGITSLKANDHVSNGSVVPIEASFSPPLVAGDSADILLTLQTGEVSVASVTVEEGKLESWSLRGISMPQSGSVVVRTNRGDSTEKNINVTTAGSVYTGEQPLDPARAKSRHRNNEALVLLRGFHVSGLLVFKGSGFAAVVTGSPHISKDPLIGFKGSIAGDVNVQKRN